MLALALSAYRRERAVEIVADGKGAEDDIKKVDWPKKEKVDTAEIMTEQCRESEPTSTKTDKCGPCYSCSEPTCKRQATKTKTENS